jgi:hypothetical protein
MARWHWREGPIPEPYLSGNNPYTGLTHSTSESGCGRVWGGRIGDGFVESVELEGGLCPWWYVHLLPKMANKINAIEYSGETPASTNSWNLK